MQLSANLFNHIRSHAISTRSTMRPRMAYETRFKAPSFSFSRLVVAITIKMIQPHRLVALTAVSLCIYKVISVDPDPAQILHHCRLLKNSQS